MKGKDTPFFSSSSILLFGVWICCLALPELRARRRSDGIIIMWTVERVWCFTSTRVPRIWDYKIQIISDTWLYGGTSFIRGDIHIAYYFPEKYIIIRIFIDFENQSLIK